MVTKLSELGSGFFSNDSLEQPAFEERLEWARGRIAETAARIRRGELCASPETCAYDGTCAYASICRTES
jgi:hypothetical protein